MKKVKRIFSVVLSLVLLIGVIFPAWADQLDDQQKKLNDVSRQINQQKSNINQAKKKEKTIMGQIQSLEQNIDKTEKDISS
ncbi:MAG: peptidase M23, partial [Syntrophomonas sp.]